MRTVLWYNAVIGFSSKSDGVHSLDVMEAVSSDFWIGLPLELLCVDYLAVIGRHQGRCDKKM